MTTASLVDSVHFQNYRNFTDFHLDGLKHINLIVGDSNVGKTGLLEGLVALWGNDKQFEKLPDTFRMSHGGNQSFLENYWQWFFPEKKVTSPVRFLAKSINSNTHIVNIPSNSLKALPIKRYTDETKFRGRPQEYRPLTNLIILPVGMGNYQQQIDQFNELAQKNKGKESLIAALQIIEPRLTGLEYLKLPTSDQAMIYADIGLEYKIPTTQFGHGFTRSMEMLTQLILSDAEVMIADEIENGIHYGSLEAVWQAIISYAMQNNIQVFATTHSRECVAAAHSAMQQQDEYSLNVIRLQNKKEEVVAINHYQEEIEVVFEMGLPLR